MDNEKSIIDNFKNDFEVQLIYVNLKSLHLKFRNQLIVFFSSFCQFKIYSNIIELIDCYYDFVNKEKFEKSSKIFDTQFYLNNLLSEVISINNYSNNTRRIANSVITGFSEEQFNITRNFFFDTVTISAITVLNSELLFDNCIMLVYGNIKIFMEEKEIKKNQNVSINFKESFLKFSEIGWVCFFAILTKKRKVTLQDLILAVFN